jgi:hypothetical protein
VSLKDLLTGSFLVTAFFGMWPPENMWMIGIGIIGAFLTRLLPEGE